MNNNNNNNSNSNNNNKNNKNCNLDKKMTSGLPEALFVFWFES